ncbi:TIGR04325 family methyltransferase [Bacillus sp. FJAT-51639]|uniref:TIGR04325 family methyltransferase n=1 Tax=Bacillus bruguierae TaxID=3127667 RepID=A0ABU8FFI8_9BACI
MTGKIYGFSGNYSSWQEIQEISTGYDTSRILDKVKEAALKVKSGEALCERDSILFNECEYVQPLIRCLLHIASCNKNKLRILDFGGSLGSSYYACRNSLKHLDELSWNIVEQKHFVDCGKQLFEEGPLKFYYSIDECVQMENPHLILFSGVIQYLEKPYEFLEQVMKYNFKFILFDRTPFFDVEDRMTLQIVPPEIYEASYPAWFFNLDKFLYFFRTKYDIIDAFDSFESWKLEDAQSQNKGFLFKKSI